MKTFRSKTAAIGLMLVLLMGVNLLSGCSQKAAGTIRIATKPMTEQFILGEMLALLIEEKTDLKVEITKGVGGGTSNIHPAMVKGEFDLYPEYTGTAWSFVLKNQDLPDDKTLYTRLQDQYLEQFGLRWVGLYGFNNTFALLVRGPYATQNNINSYSDLAPFSPQLIFGSEYDFYEREDGYDALCTTYGFKFKKAIDLDIGLKYQAIIANQVDVINAFTTDGQLSAHDFKVLEDDRSFFPSYYCGTVIRQETLDKNPQLQDVLMSMEGIISDSEMAKMNYAVEKSGQNEKDVAREFLQSKGLIK